MHFSVLCKKEVINVNDGCCLGNVNDLRFDERKGGIEELIVPGPGKWLGCLGREIEYHIPWCRIVRIGPDIILVDVCEREVQQNISKGCLCAFFD